jgi:hypothetical protein
MGARRSIRMIETADARNIAGKLENPRIIDVVNHGIGSGPVEFSMGKCPPKPI